MASMSRKSLMKPNSPAVRNPSVSKRRAVENSEMNGQIVGQRFKLKEIIGKGSFGELRVAKDIKNNGMVAVKLEKINDKLKVAPLSLEYQCYQMVGSTADGFPKIHFYGQCAQYNAMVMELLGRDLETVFNDCGRQFSLKTVIYVIIQLLQRIEHVHNSNLVFRDIKPENFVLGLEGTPKENIIHIIDFGLAKQYFDSETKTHIPMTEKRPLTGTARYMSINSHLQREQSRRDDLEAIGYMIMYFLKHGKLPWTGLVSKTPKERYEKIGLFKRGTPIETLCYGFPDPFANYFRYVRQLEFEETPDYRYLKVLFIKLFDKEKLDDDGYYDWN